MTLLCSPIVAQAGDDGRRAATSLESTGSGGGDASLFDRYLLSEDVSGVDAFSAASSSAPHARPWGWRGHGRRGEPPCVTRPPARSDRRPTDEEPVPTPPEPEPSPESAFVPEPTALATADEYGAPPMLGDFITAGGTQLFQLEPLFAMSTGSSPPFSSLDGRFLFSDTDEGEVTGLTGVNSQTGETLPGTFEARPDAANGLTSIHVEGDTILPAHLSQAFNTGVLKYAEGGSPLPVDRLIFNYHYFDNAALFQGGVNVHRFVPGFEKTFFNGMASIEVRVPMLVTLDSTIDIQSRPGAVNTQHGELGNLRITPKLLLHQQQGFAVGAGLPILVPTADDIVFELADGSDFLRVKNEAVHLAPYLGAVYAPNSRFFTQGFAQLDIDANGNPVRMAYDPTGLSGEALPPSIAPAGVQSARIGRLNDPVFLFLDWQAGYWFKREQDPCARGLTGLAGIFELHYSGSLDETDSIIATIPGIEGDVGRVGADVDNIDVWSLTIGSVFEFDYDSSLMLGYSVPAGEGADEPFDGELRVLFTHRFGPSSRLGRTVFQ